MVRFSFAVLNSDALSVSLGNALVTSITITSPTFEPLSLAFSASSATSITDISPSSTVRPSSFGDSSAFSSVRVALSKLSPSAFSAG